MEDPKFNVLVLESRLIYGGVENLLYNVFTRVDKSKFRVVICTLYDHGPMGVPFIKSGYRLVHSVIKNRYDFRGFHRLRRVIRAHKIELIYVVVQPLTIFWAFVIGKLFRIPIVCLIGNTLVSKGSPKLWMYRLFLPFVDCIVTQADLQRDHLIKNEGFPARLMTVIHNGIDCRPFDVAIDRRRKLESLGVRNDCQIVGVVSRLVKLKGIDVFLEAARILHDRDPALQFIIVGVGDESQSLRDLCTRLRMERNVHFLGFRDDLSELVSVFDVAVLPSRTEAFPMVLLEYMAAGRPIVATNVGSVSEVVDNGVTGITVQSEDPRALAEKIHLLLRDRELAEMMAGNARKAVREKFGIENTVNRTESLMSEMIRKRKRN